MSRYSLSVGIIILFINPLSAQEASPFLFLPAPLDSLQAQGIQSLSVYYSDYQAGGNQDEAGLLVASFQWIATRSPNNSPRLSSAVSLFVQEGMIRSKDSLSWTYEGKGRKAINQFFQLFPADPDYTDYAEPLNFGNLKEMVPIRWETGYGPEEQISLYGPGRKRMLKEFSAYDSTYFRYDDDGTLIEKYTLNPERQAMGMGGESWETYLYDDQGNMIQKWEIVMGPNGARDSSRWQYAYDEAGRLIGGTSIRHSIA